MAQHDQTIASGAGVAVRNDINAAISALFSSSSGATEPTIKVPGQLWFDTSVVGVSSLKVRNQANSAWNGIGHGSDLIANSLTVDPATGDAALVLDKAASGNNCRIYGKLAGVTRWHVSIGNNTPETGSDVGSDYTINRYNDAGTIIDVPLTITRSTGNVTLAQ